MKSPLNSLHLRLVGMFGVLALSAVTFIAFSNDMKAGVFCAAITLCYLIMLGVLYIISRRSVSPDMPGSGLSSLTIDFL